MQKKISHATRGPGDASLVTGTAASASERRVLAQISQNELSLGGDLRLISDQALKLIVIELELIVVKLS